MKIVWNKQEGEGMSFVKDNLLYDTEKSTLLHSWSRCPCYMTDYYRVWKTKGGHYFILSWENHYTDADESKELNLNQILDGRYVGFDVITKKDDMIKYLAEKGQAEILRTHPEFKDHITEA